jgi:tetratricopeptide (TPR) repeat protein
MEERMSKKKRDKSREARKRWTAMKESLGRVPVLPDPRALEGSLRELARGGAEPHTPLEKAEDLLMRAHDVHDPEKRCQIAQQALAICPDCADAYVVLAENAGSRTEALTLYEQGVAAGERALGERCVRELAGHFWSPLETRPYMRAREGLARMLWASGQREAAVGHIQEMLRLNPNDNQGLRYRLLACCFWLERLSDLQELLDRYPNEGSAVWAYGRALLAFRTEGDTAASRELLRQARKTNKHVPAYLLELKFPPEHAPDCYSPGQESEAIFFIRESLGVWNSTPGAIDWLRAQVEPGSGKAAATEPPRTLAPVEKNKLLAIPRRSVFWQVDFRQLPNVVQHAGRRVHPSVVVVMHSDSGLILAAELTEKPVSADFLWKTLVKCMRTPAAGGRSRPAKIQARPHDLWESLRPSLQEVGTELVVSDSLGDLDSVFVDMLGRFGAEPQAGLLDTPGVAPAQVEAAYAAAAGFYRAAPWKKLAYESALEIACNRFPGGPWYAVIMGQASMTFGLSIYDDLRLLRLLLRGRLSDHESGRRTVATTLVFGTDAELPLPDLEAAERHGWEVAGPRAYPWIFRKQADEDPHPPEAWQIELLDAALRAIPEFVSRRRQADGTREDLVVTTASGDTALMLRWIVD